MKKNIIEIDVSAKITIAAKEGKTLNKPFRTPKGPKKFSVYVKNEKGNIVKVNFGDPNMEIKRDDPNRRKNFRARHQCDKNPGPKWKARYWSCKMWESNKSVTDYTSASILASQEVWDGETLWAEEEILQVYPELQNAPVEPDEMEEPENEMEESEDEMEEYKNEYLEMSIGSLNSIKTHAENILNALNDEKVKENLTEPFLQGKIAITEDYMVMIHNYLMFAEESDASYMSSGPMFMVGQKVRNINKSCYHYGSEGIIKEVKELPDRMGKVVSYEVTNEGPTYKKGDILTKTVDQLARASMCASYEEEEEYKSMYESDGQNFKDFLQKCIPSKEGSDKEKFQACLLEYKKNK